MGSGFFDEASVETMIGQHESGRSDHAAALWLLLAFEGFLFADAAVGTTVARAAE